MRARLVLLLVLAVGAAACTPGDIDLVLEEFPSEDLSQSDDPGERSAGESAIEILTIREAEDNLERGLDEMDADAVAQAERLRPDDPKYDFYEAAVLAGRLGQGDPAASEAYGRAMQDGGADFGAAHPEMDDAERGRAAIERYLSILRDVIRAAPSGDENDRRIESYCLYIEGFYPDQYTERFPQEVSFYLAVEADFSLCS